MAALSYCLSHTWALSHTSDSSSGSQNGQRHSTVSNSAILNSKFLELKETI